MATLFKERFQTYRPMTKWFGLVHSEPICQLPTSSTSPGSPSSPCRCRRCSLLPLEECEPKEVSALFKFLRRRKVKIIEKKKLFRDARLEFIVSMENCLPDQLIKYTNAIITKPPRNILCKKLFMIWIIYKNLTQPNMVNFLPPTLWEVER